MALTKVGYTDFSGTAQVGSGPGATSSLTVTIPTTPQSDLCVVLLAGSANGTGTLSALTAQASGGPVKSATFESVSGLWFVNVPSGTTSVTFVGTFTGGTDQLAILCLWTTTGDAAPTWGTGTDSGSGNTTGSCSVNAGGVVFAIGQDQGGGTCNIVSGATQDGHPASVSYGSNFIVAGHNNSAGGGTVSVTISVATGPGEVFLAPLNPSGGGGTNVNLTAVAATGAVASFARSESKSLTGVAATGAVAAFTRSPSKALTPATATGAVAAFSEQISSNVTLTAVAATGAIAAFTTKIDESPSLTAVAATGAVGSFSPTIGVSVNLTGVAGVGAVASFGSAVSKALSAAAATGSVGSFIAGDNPILVGVAGTGAVGSFGPSASALPSLGAVSATGVAEPFTVTSGAIVSLTGVEGLGQVGSFTPNIPPPPSSTPPQRTLVGVGL